MLQWTENRTVPPNLLPISLDDLRAQLRLVQGSGDQTHDVDLQRVIEASVTRFEDRTQIALMPQTWQFQLRCMGDAQWIPRPPLVSITSLKYWTDDGALMTVNPSTYWAIPEGWPGVLAWPASITRPTPAADRPYPWQLEVVAGYSAPSKVPADIRQGLLQLAAFMHRNRETAADVAMVELPHAFESLVTKYQVMFP